MDAFRRSPNIWGENVLVTLIIHNVLINNAQITPFKIINSIGCLNFGGLMGFQSLGAWVVSTSYLTQLQHFILPSFPALLSINADIWRLSVDSNIDRLLGHLQPV